MACPIPLRSLLQRSYRQNPPGKRRQPSKDLPEHTTPWQEAAGFMPLVEADRLFFRIVPNAECLPSQLPHGDTTETGTTFRSAFAEVWGQLPEPDRHCLLDYWRTGKLWVLPGEEEALAFPRPWVQIETEVGPGGMTSACDKFGLRLRFPGYLMAGSTSRLRRVIARALVHAFGYATREWSRIDDRFEKLLGIDEQKKALGREYYKTVRASVEETLRRWGIEGE